jgi:hypothetical protein
VLILWHLCKGWAALMARHDEQAIEFATQAAAANPEFPDIYAVLASANGHLGRAGPARAALEQLLQRMPGLTASDRSPRPPFCASGRPGALPRRVAQSRDAGVTCDQPR